MGILTTASAGTIKVVTTTTDLKSITELIGGDKVSVSSIATGYQNPHFVDPKPSYIISLSNADLFVTVGLDLETGWSPQLLASSCLLYTSPSPRDRQKSRMPSSA